MNKKAKAGKGKGSEQQAYYTDTRRAPLDNIPT
jgi:hypothetical protein